MTASDRARAVRIAAHGLARGRNASEVESTLSEYMPGLDPAEIPGLLFDARTAVRIGELATQGQTQLAEALLVGLQQSGGGAAYALVHYQIGPDAEKDWRSTRILQRAGESLAQMTARASAEVGALYSQAPSMDSNPRAGWTQGAAEQSMEIEFIGTTGLPALP